MWTHDMSCLAHKLKELRLKAAVDLYQLVREGSKPLGCSFHKQNRLYNQYYLNHALSTCLAGQDLSVANGAVVGNGLVYGNLVRGAHFDSRKGGDGRQQSLPKLFYVQNPLIWATNKLDFRFLKRKWDPTFSEAEFQRGCRQAVSKITHLVSKETYDSLKPLLTKQALLTLRREVEIFWADEVKRNIALKPEDVQLIIPRKIHFRSLANKRFCDIDMVFIGLKWIEAFAIKQQILFVDIIARFHRNYSDNILYPDWTVSAFRVRRCSILPDKNN